MRRSLQFMVCSKQSSVCSSQFTVSSKLLTVNRKLVCKPLTVNRKAMALFMPVFTIAFIIALFTLVSYTLADKMESLSSNGVGADAVVVTKSLWTEDIEIAEQESMLKSYLCTALNNTYNDIGVEFENIDFSRIVEKTLQDNMNSISIKHSIGISSINPLIFSAIPKSVGYKTFVTTLYNPEADDDNSKVRTINISRPTIHELRISSDFNIAPIIIARDELQKLKRKCALDRTFDSRTSCMKSIMRDGIDGVIFIVKGSGENSALAQNEYIVEVVVVSKPSWCSYLGRTSYTITLPDIFDK